MASVELRTCPGLAMLDPAPKVGRVVATAAALFAGTFLLYLPSLHHGFVGYDDLRVVLDHPELYDEHSFLRGLRQILFQAFPREEPLLLRDVTWALDSRLFGFRNPLGYHLGNVVLNAANTALLFVFLLRTTASYGRALAVASLFAVLPVHVEAVSWVMGRKDVLCAALVLIVLILEAMALDAGDERRRNRLRLVAALVYPLTILAKFSAVSLVLVLAAFRVLAPTLRGRPSLTRAQARPALLGLAPHLLISVGLYLWYGRILASWGVIGGIRTGLTAEHLGQVARFVPLVVGLYLRSLVTAADHSIAYLWPHTFIPLTATQRLASFLLAAALAALLIWSWRRRRDLCFYALAFLALLLPYFNIVVDIIWRADRYLYLAAFCPLAIVVDLAAGLPRRGRQLAAAGGALWVASAVLVTLARQPAFRDAQALWTYEVSLSRPAVVAYHALARSLVARAATERDPATRSRWLDQAEATARAGMRYFESIPWRVPAGVHLSPRLDYANLEVQLGRVSDLRHEPLAEQIAHYRRSYAIAPTVANSLMLAQTLFERAARQGDLAGARESLAFYREYIVNVRADAGRRPQLAAVLDEQYRQRFPSLGPAVDAIEQEQLR